jgi:hypothetical protein
MSYIKPKITQDDINIGCRPNINKRMKQRETIIHTAAVVPSGPEPINYYVICGIVISIIIYKVMGFTFLTN